MTWVSGDRVKETTITTGTGDITLAGAVSQFRAFSAICANGDTFFYTIAGQTGTEWEVGVGTYNNGPNTLTRSQVLASSNAGALVNFSAGTKDVFLDYAATQGVVPPARRVITVDTPIPPGASYYVPADLEVASGVVLEAGIDAVVEVG